MARLIAVFVPKGYYGTRNTVRLRPRRVKIPLWGNKTLSIRLWSRTQRIRHYEPSKEILTHFTANGPDETLATARMITPVGRRLQRILWDRRTDVDPKPRIWDEEKGWKDTLRAQVFPD